MDFGWYTEGLPSGYKAGHRVESVWGRPVCAGSALNGTAQRLLRLGRVKKGRSNRKPLRSGHVTDFTSSNIAPAGILGQPPIRVSLELDWTVPKHALCFKHSVASQSSKRIFHCVHSFSRLIASTTVDVVMKPKREGGHASDEIRAGIHSSYLTVACALPE